MHRVKKERDINMGTIIISIILFAIIAAIAVKTVKDKKTGKSSCGCGCSSCAMSEACGKRGIQKK